MNVHYQSPKQLSKTKRLSNGNDRKYYLTVCGKWVRWGNIEYKYAFGGIKTPDCIKCLGR